MIPADFQPTLVGPHVIVRPIAATDWHELFAVAADPEIWALHPVPIAIQNQFSACSLMVQSRRARHFLLLTGSAARLSDQAATTPITRHPRNRDRLDIPPASLLGRYHRCHGSGRASCSSRRGRSSGSRSPSTKANDGLGPVGLGTTSALSHSN